MAEPPPFVVTNIPQRMDRLPWSNWHWLVVSALGVTWLLDGLEVSTFYMISAFDTKRYVIQDNQRSFTLNDDLVNVDFLAIRTNE